MRFCRHCDLTRSRRRDGLCDACNIYLARYGRLPGHRVIARRVRRAVERELVVTAWGRWVA